MKNKVLSVTKSFDIRFSEVDSMGVVWHGNYAKYFEDAREEFGRKYFIFHYNFQSFESISVRAIFILQRASSSSPLLTTASTNVT